MTREQFTAYVEDCQEAFRRFLTALCCGDSALADDIAQESLIKAYLSSDGLSSPEKFRAWLYRIGYNTFLNHQRTGRIFTGYDAAAAEPAADRADRAFEYQELYAALALLPDRERTSTLLYYMQGYSVKEIADITEASADAVKQHLSRGRSRLRHLLKE